MDATKEYITIKQFAERVGVSNQAVYQRLNKDLDKYIKVVDNKKMLSIKALELFNVKAVEQANSESLTSNSSELTSALKEQIEFLKAENKQKQGQVEQLQEQLNIEREHSRQQSDKLTALAEQMLELTSNSQKLQLADKVMTNKNIDPGAEEVPGQPGQNQDTQKGFFSRFFTYKNK
jgi:hypothetical protein